MKFSGIGLYGDEKTTTHWAV